MCIPFKIFDPFFKVLLVVNLNLLTYFDNYIMGKFMHVPPLSFLNNFGAFLCGNIFSIGLTYQK